MSARLVVLASGGGSNLQAILDHLSLRAERAHARVVAVGSNRHDAGALHRADHATVPTFVVDRTGPALEESLDQYKTDLVILAGYLSLVPPAVTRRWAGRILNIHPALLPAFGGHGMYGRHVHESVIESGARVSGATVHFVTDEYDRGPIIAQWPVPVFPRDDADTLAARVLTVEHVLYPRVIDAVASGRLRLDGNRVIDDRAATGSWTFSRVANDSALHASIDALVGA